jgi:hypothetical protein
MRTLVGIPEHLGCHVIVHGANIAGHRPATTVHLVAALTHVPGLLCLIVKLLTSHNFSHILASYFENIKSIANAAPARI